jgi:hypothetical protein
MGAEGRLNSSESQTVRVVDTLEVSHRHLQRTAIQFNQAAKPTPVLDNDRHCRSKEEGLRKAQLTAGPFVLGATSRCGRTRAFIWCGTMLRRVGPGTTLLVQQRDLSAHIYPPANLAQQHHVCRHRHFLRYHLTNHGSAEMPTPLTYPNVLLYRRHR